MHNLPIQSVSGWKPYKHKTLKHNYVLRADLGNDNPEYKQVIDDALEWCELNEVEAFKAVYYTSTSFLVALPTDELNVDFVLRFEDYVFRCRKLPHFQGKTSKP